MTQVVTQNEVKKKKHRKKNCNQGFIYLFISEKIVLIRLISAKGKSFTIFPLGLGCIDFVGLLTSRVTLR